MAKKAVLVGCNYPGTKAELHGCINDVHRIHKTLVNRFGFQEEDITVLIDTDKRHLQPTGVNIKRSLNKIVAEAQSGDILFFHFSGHGVRLPAETGEIDDTGYDECIVPCDMNLITDDDFREIVNRLPPGVTLTLVSDSCHSGGLIKNAREQIGESSHPGGVHQGSLRDFVSDAIRGSLEDRGIHLPSFGHHHGERRGRRRYMDEDEYYQRVQYDGQGHAKSRALPISTLVEILKQKTGKDDLDIGMIRPTLFDMFGDDSSSKVKKFVKVILQGIHHNGEGHGSGHHGLIGAVGALAQEFLKHKLEEVGDADEYLKPALQAHVPDHAVAYAGEQVEVSRDMGILVSGCQSSETSADANPTGKAHESYGAMSNALQMVLAEQAGPITNYQLVTRLRELLRKQGYAQHPGLYCRDENSCAPFICR